MKVAMNLDITAKVDRARADLKAAQRWLAIELAKCVIDNDCNSSAKLVALISEVKLLEAAEYVADSRSRGGEAATSHHATLHRTRATHRHACDHRTQHQPTATRHATPHLAI